MKILHVIPSLAAADGGPSRAVRLMQQALLAQGADVEIATTCESDDHDGTGEASVVLAADDKVRQRYFPRDVNPYKVSFAFARWIFRHAGDYDLIHVHALFSFTTTVTAIAARRAGVAYVVRPLGTLNRYGVTKRRPWLKRLSMALIERRLLSRAAAVHFTSAFEQSEAESLGLSMHGVVIPLAVPPAVAAGEHVLSTHFPELRDKQYVLYLSRLDPKKNVEGLLAAINQCATALPGMRWLIAGEGATAYAAQLRAQAAKLNVADRVIWAGHIDGELKAAALAGASLFVLPSFSENFGIAAAEALAAGVPCVLGRGVAIAEELADAGAALSIDTDPESIAEAMIRLAKDAKLCAAMSLNAKNYAQQHFSMSAMGRDLAKLYGETLARTPRKVIA